MSGRTLRFLALALLAATVTPALGQVPKERSAVRERIARRAALNALRRERALLARRSRKARVDRVERATPPAGYMFLTEL